MTATTTPRRIILDVPPGPVDPATELAIERVATELASINARLIRELRPGHYMCGNCCRIGPAAELTPAGADKYRHPHGDRRDCPADLAVGVCLRLPEEVLVKSA